MMLHVRNVLGTKGQGCSKDRWREDNGTVAEWSWSRNKSYILIINSFEKFTLILINGALERLGKIEYQTLKTSRIKNGLANGIKILYNVNFFG